ncbi:MAG TPA: MerR family transcriptional regulator [Dehalococcoidia bacterium]|nr:MerR family transcriptional regulator [Dehalococcoidia bacterium]
MGEGYHVPGARARSLNRRAAAELVRIDIRRLRRYEQVGLVQPVRGQSGEPVYTEAELARIRRIQRLIDHCGLNLAGVEVVLRLTDQMQELSRRAEAQTAEPRRLLDTR